MRFSFAALLLGVSTVVSALPIAHSTSSLELEGRESVDVSDMFERGFDEPATVVLYPRTRSSARLQAAAQKAKEVAEAKAKAEAKANEPVPYHVALHRSKVGTVDEHWSVRFHPQEKSQKDVWHVVHAVSNNKDGKGVLETEHLVHGQKDDKKHGAGYDPAHHNEHHHILGSYKDHESAAAAAHSLTQFKCKKQYADHNCVDWTKQAIDHLHAEKHIDDDKHKHFTELYEANKDAVREKTNTPENRKNTWGKTDTAGKPGDHK
jgi:hypothetical protein